jgi:DNA-directed RNA polymerase subunit RPC12/RpoP
MIEYKCASCGLTLYRVYAERAKKGYYVLYEELYSSGGYTKRRCYIVLSPTAIARIYEKCPRCGKPLQAPTLEDYKERIKVQ